MESRDARGHEIYKGNGLLHRGHASKNQREEITERIVTKRKSEKYLQTTKNIVLG